MLKWSRNGLCFIGNFFGSFNEKCLEVRMILFQQYIKGGTIGPSNDKFQFIFTKIRGGLPEEFDQTLDTLIFEG